MQWLVSDFLLEARRTVTESIQFMWQASRARARLFLVAIVGLAIIFLVVTMRVVGQPALRTDEVVRDLTTPWAIAFAPDGRIFVTERSGQIRIIRAGRLALEPWAVVQVWQSPLRSNAAGLLGLALDPEFGTNPFVYIYHTYEADGEAWARVVRLREQDGRGVVDRVILDRIHANPTHVGGRILFGPDGLLYVGTGDSGKAERAQDRTSLAGKILRITSDGGIPPGNPFPGSPVYSLGHRNVQGFGWHPKTKQLYATEHGPTAREECCRDELNVIEPGRNYGWPIVTGAPGNPRFADSVTDSGERSTWAPAGATFVTQGPWANSFLFTGLRGETLYRAVLTGPQDLRVARIERHLVKRFGRLRDIVEAPDGKLCFLTNNVNNASARPRPGDDKLIRLTVEP